MSVLVVDDNPSNVALLTTLLEDEGLHRITTLTDSRQVEHLLPSLDPDLVLLDLHMPYIDGYVLLQTITQFAAGTYLPVLVLTADSTTDARDRALGQRCARLPHQAVRHRRSRLASWQPSQTRQLYGALRRTARLDLAPTTEGELSERRRGPLIFSGIEASRSTTSPSLICKPAPIVGHEALARFPTPHAAWSR